MSRPPKLLQTTLLDGVSLGPVARAVAAGRSCEPVWRNEAGGVTFRIADGAEFVKVGPVSLDWHPAEEVARLAWAAPRLLVPRVLGHGVRGADGWLHTRGIPARSAVDPHWQVRPEVAVPALGRALRTWHDTMPVDSCGFSWSVAYRVERFGLDRRFLDHVPPLDSVVCHGDACNPNFLLDEFGAPAGYVDLSGLGVADRWADLAPALLSLQWNYAGTWDSVFLAAYGTDEDPAKRDFYTRLWNGVEVAVLGRPDS